VGTADKLFFGENRLIIYTKSLSSYFPSLPTTDSMLLAG